MKKVLAIAPYSYLPFSSGGQKLIARFFEYLGKETELTVVTVAENDFSLVNNYKATALLKKPFSRYLDTTLTKKIIALIQKEKFDFIIWEHPYFAWLAYRVKMQTGIQTIIHTHNIEHQRFRSIGKWWWKILKWYERWFFRFADHIFFTTPEDKESAIKFSNINRRKCIDLPFGMDIKEYPSDRDECRLKIIQAHNIEEGAAVLLFNGALDYKPNQDALMLILKEINPLMIKKDFKYKIIICGRGLPEHLKNLEEYTSQSIIYAGFVDDIESYFKAADVFLNPVETGGGIKTKMVEAIGFGANVVATTNGAMGMKKEVSGNKLVVVEKNDWRSFADAVVQNAAQINITPPAYYEYYYWGNIVKNAMTTLAQHTAAQPVDD